MSEMQQDETGPKETAYDELVAPLMVQIIDICKEHSINHFATFSLDDLDDGDGPLMCTTSVPLNDGGDAKGLESAIALTDLVTNPGGSIAMTIRKVKT